MTASDQLASFAGRAFNDSFVPQPAAWSVLRRLAAMRPESGRPTGYKLIAEAAVFFEARATPE
jgi:hypothetical protein